MIKGFMENIPSEIMEAAWIDGADVWTVYTKIAMPLASPAIASVSIFNFCANACLVYMTLNYMPVKQRIRTHTAFEIYLIANV
jgi:ABC-type glycerol-3-phosphate transport system permease component